MAVPPISQPAGQEGQVAADESRSRRSALRERFDSLPNHIKDSIRNEHRDFNVSFVDWWDFVYDDFKADMDKIGIRLVRMYFSGFWSQGDGACFEGYVYDWDKFLPSIGYTCPALINHANDAFSFSCEHKGYYYHENCVRFMGEFPMPEDTDDEAFMLQYVPKHDMDTVHLAVAMALLMQHAKTDFEQEFADAFKGHMRDLYRRLNEEHDYLTSDEAVLDSLEANDKLEDLINESMELENA